MSAGLLVFLAVAPSSPSTTSDADVLTLAERAFADGTRWRSDSVRARPAFAQSAAAYDELWRRGHRSPDLARNRASAHRLAGNLPGAIVALNEGLSAARWNRSLQSALEEARSAVVYPALGDLAAKCRPPTPTGIATRMSPAEAWGIAAVAWLLACVAVARFAMSRAPVWLAFAGVGLIALALLGSLWLQDYCEQERENVYPRVVVAEDAFLRKGNAESFPVRLPESPKLPRGTEARELSRRGGWVQVQLACGLAGWIPEPSVLKVGG